MNNHSQIYLRFQLILLLLMLIFTYRMMIAQTSWRDNNDSGIEKLPGIDIKEFI